MNGYLDLMPPGSLVSVSVVVPVYSGEQFLYELVQQLGSVRAKWIEQQAPIQLAEVILVDDAAIDGSPSIIDELADRCKWITALHLMRNFGQHAATVVGVLHSSGDWVVTMDEDLQHSPMEIERLLRKAVISNADVVYARPTSPVHEAWTRDRASRGFKRAMALVTGNPGIAFFNSFRLLRGPLARAASSACGHETYFDVAISWFTNRIQVVFVGLKDRRFIATGTSGYKFSRLLTHARRMFISSHIKATRLLGFVGILVVAASIIGSFEIIVQKLAAPSTITADGWPSLVLINLFFGGFITFMISVLLEYISILVLAAHGKPVFFVVDRSSDKKLAEFFEMRPPCS